MKTPQLPPRQPNGDLWPAETASWYALWSDLSPFEWAELAIAAVLHARVWSGDANGSVACELRKRTEALAAARRANLEAAEVPAVAPRPKRDLRLIEERS